jgi:hypothetical protein
MRISISTAQNSHQGVAIDTFAKEVEKRTGGRYKVQTFYNGALGGERESIEAVQLGTQELAFSSTGPVPNFVPETKILDVPFLFRDKAHARAVLDGPIGQEMLTKFDAKGFKALAWAENGFPPHDQQQARRERARRPEGPEDAHHGEPGAHRRLQGLWHHHHAHGLPRSVHRPAARHRGRPGEPAVRHHLGQVRPGAKAPHADRPRVFALHLRDEQGGFDKLSAADKQAFIDAAKEGTKANRARVDEDDAKGVADLRAKGMTVVDNVDKAKFVAALAPVNAEFEKQFGKANIDKIRRQVSGPLHFR